MGETIIRIVNLPRGINGFVSEDSEGDYNIYVSALLTYEQQRKVIIHELRHINSDDFRNDLPIEVVENLV